MFIYLKSDGYFHLKIRHRGKLRKKKRRAILSYTYEMESVAISTIRDLPGKYRIIDGDRRWTNCVILVEAGKAQYRHLPVEITDRTLSDEERLRAWIYIHRQRKEWDAREKEMVAYRLVELLGRASAANILGVTVRELDKLVKIYELSERFENLREPGPPSLGLGSSWV